MTVKTTEHVASVIKKDTDSSLIKLTMRSKETKKKTIGDGELRIGRGRIEKCVQRWQSCD